MTPRGKLRSTKRSPNRAVGFLDPDMMPTQME